MSGSRTHLRLAASLSLIAVLGPSAVDMYLGSMPEMASDLSTGFSNIQMSLTTFLLALGFGQLMFGPVIDAFGRRLPLLAALCGFIVAGLGTALAQTVEALLIARFIQGLAASLTLVVAMSTVRDVAEGDAAAKLFALLMTIVGLTPVVAPAIGGLVDQAFGWRGVMWTLTGLGTLALLNSIFNLPESLPKERRVAFRVRTVALEYARILKDRSFLAPALGLYSVFFFLFAYIGGAGLVYQTSYGLTPASFGAVFGATGVAVLIGAMSSTLLIKRYALAGVAVRGGALMLLGAAVAAITALTTSNLAGIVVGMGVSMFGLGVAEAGLMAMAMGSQEKSLGLTAALLGGLQLSIGAAATPLAAALGLISPAAWTGLLVCSGLLACVLIALAAKGHAVSGARLEPATPQEAR